MPLENWQEYKYAISEKFLSIQGEGSRVGEPMAFVRLSGCPVGKAAGICKSWDGREFQCDTGSTYNKGRNHTVEHHSYTEINEKLTASEIITWVLENKFRVLSLTGGEPLSHNLEPLYLASCFIDPHVNFHIETSGTEPHPDWFGKFHHNRVHVVLSPKFGWNHNWLFYCNEVKLLVSLQTTSEEIKDLIYPWTSFSRKVFLQPIEDDSWPGNISHAIELCKELQVRLSVQIHKWIGQR